MIITHLIYSLISFLTITHLNYENDQRKCEDCHFWCVVYTWVLGSLTPPKVTRVILFNLYVFISLKIDQLVDIIMDLGYKSISGNPGKTRPLISGIPGNDWKF